ncbi:MAG: hypothetical protein RL497_1057 [Pseudomonadota bacterium]|jgi:hypothetical protein
MEDDEERDFEQASDEESLNIRRLERELHAVGAFENKHLFVGLGAGLVFILLHTLRPSYFTQIAVLVFVPVSVLGGLALTFFRSARKKKNILIQYGLRCKHCGFIPSTLNASGVLCHKTCLKCHLKLDG